MIMQWLRTSLTNPRCVICEKSTDTSNHQTMLSPESIIDQAFPEKIQTKPAGFCKLFLWSAYGALAYACLGTTMYSRDFVKDRLGPFYILEAMVIAVALCPSCQDHGPPSTAFSRPYGLPYSCLPGAVCCWRSMWAFITTPHIIHHCPHHAAQFDIRLPASLDLGWSLVVRHDGVSMDLLARFRHSYPEYHSDLAGTMCAMWALARW